MIKDVDSSLVDHLHPSPNIEPRRGDMAPTILLMHYTGMASAERAADWLSRPESKVSCHYLIDEAGVITQMVAEDMRAWHAGRSFWAGERDINSASIGIEIQNPGHDDGYHDFPEAQMASVVALSQDIVKRHGIRPERVLAHSDVAPDRKIDPGEKFDWKRLADAGVGLWVAPEPVQENDEMLDRGARSERVLDVQKLLHDYGYGLDLTGELDEQTVFVLRAFQLHFRPSRISCVIDRSTELTLRRLTSALFEAAPA